MHFDFKRTFNPTPEEEADELAGEYDPHIVSAQLGV